MTAPPAPVSVGTLNAAAGAGPFNVPIPAGYVAGNTVIASIVTNFSATVQGVVDSNGNQFRQVAVQGFDTSAYDKRVDDFDPSITYSTSPAWTTTTSGGGYYQSTFHYATAAGATATFQFTGTYVSIQSARGTDRGIFTVAIDGGPPVTIDCYISTALNIQTVFSAVGLPNGLHTVVMTATGTKNPSASNTIALIDSYTYGVDGTGVGGAGVLSVWMLDNGLALPANGTVNITVPGYTPVSARVMTVSGLCTVAVCRQNSGGGAPWLATGPISLFPQLLIAAEANSVMTLTWYAPLAMVGAGAVSGNNNGFMHVGSYTVGGSASVTAQMSTGVPVWGMILLLLNTGVLAITSVLPTAIVGQFYNAPLIATWGFPPYVWGASPLPDGLRVENGVIRGIPATGGTTNVTITCTDASGATVSVVQPLVVFAPPVVPPDDVWVEILDTNLVSQAPVQFATVQAQLFYNAVGNWSVLAPYSDALWNLMMSPSKLNGNFVVRINWRGMFEFGGKCETPGYSDSIPGSGGGVSGVAGAFITLAGADYLSLVANRICYPDPSKPWNQQTSAGQGDVVVNFILETAIKNYVNKNMGSQSFTLFGGTVIPPAIASRQNTLLDIANDQGRGPRVNYSPRFGSGVNLNLLDVIRSLIAQNYDINNRSTWMGVRVTRNGTRLVFDVYQPRDLSGTAWFSEDTGNLTSIQFSLTDPTVTDALVQGSTIFVQKTAAGTNQWNKIEQFVDDSAETDANNVNAMATDTLVSGGQGPQMVTTVTDTPYLVYGRDYGLGDIVTVQVRGTDSLGTPPVIYTDVVSSVTLTCDPSQTPPINVVPTIGNSTDSSATDLSITGQLKNRIKAIEKRLATGKK